MSEYINLVLCESPLQLSNCIKVLSNNNQVQKSFFIIRLNGMQKNDLLIKKIISDHKLKHYVVEINIASTLTSKLHIRFLHLYVLFLLSKSNVINIFIGDARNKWMINSNTLFFYKNKNVFFIDDGMATLNSISYIERLQSKLVKKITVFTSFDIQSNIVDIMKVDKKKKEVQIDEESIIFIGSPLIEKNITNKSKYIDVLIKIAEKNKHFSNRVYVLHRAENALTEKELLLIGFNQVISLEMDVVTAFDTGLLSAKQIVGFYSTALCQIDDLFININVIAYYPRVDFFEETFIENINHVYKYFIDSTSVNVIDI